VEPLTKRSIQLLKRLYNKGQSTNTYTLRVKQDELSKQLDISRQALNVHLRKLKSADTSAQDAVSLTLPRKGSQH
jgi:DNA-binding MarR family transcriptional regulator